MNLPPVLRQRYYDSDGAPLAGGKLHTYEAGTTTPQATYKDQAGSQQNDNPIILDANGEAEMWLDPDLSYKFVLTDSADTEQWTVDGVVGLFGNDSVSSIALRNGSVTAPKIEDNAVTSDKLSSSSSVDKIRAVVTNAIRNGAVTPAKLAPLNRKTSHPSMYATERTDDTFATVLELHDAGAGVHKITTTGRPVLIGLQREASSTETSYIGAESDSALSSDTRHAEFKIRRDGEDLATFDVFAQFASGASSTRIRIPPGMIWMIDHPTAGEHLYDLQFRAVSSNTKAVVLNVEMYVFEL